MPDATERFITATTGPLAANPELEIAAQRELRGMIEEASGATKGDSLEECVERLEAKPKGRGLWICLSMALLSLALAGYGAWEIHRDREWLKSMTDIMEFPDRDATEAYVGKGLSESQRLLLFGDPSQTDLTKRLEGLWRFQPDRIDLFQEYASVHLTEKRTLPADFREIVDRLDPGNGYFSVMEAMASGRKSVEQLPRPSGKLPRPLPPPSWNIKDRSKLEEALLHLEKAMAAPRIHSHAEELKRERLSTIPRPVDSAGRLARTLYFGYQPNFGSELLDLAKMAGAKAELCGKENDSDGFRRLLSTWESFEDRFYRENSNSAFMLMVSRALSHAVRENMIATAGILGMSEEAQRLRAASTKLKEVREQQQESPVRKQRANEIREGAGYLIAVSSIVEEHRPEAAPAITRGEMKPGRMVEYAVADRVGAVAAWFLLIPFPVLAALYRFRSGALCRDISGRLVALLSPSDHLRIAASCVAPLVVLLGLGQSPLGGRQWSSAVHGMTLPAGQLLATLLLMIVLPLMVIRRRISARGSRVGLSGKTGYLDWIVVFCCIASILVLGIAGNIAGPDGDRHFFGEVAGATFALTEAVPPYKTFLITTAALLSLAAVCLFARGMMAIFSSRAKALRRTVVSRALVPAYLTGMLAIGLTIPLHRALERYWVECDRLTDITPESVPQNVYEWGVTSAATSELLNALQAHD